MIRPDMDFTNEQDLDTLLESSLIELPPEDIVATVTPWKKAMKYILIGFALNTLTLHFLYLNYILPAIGMILTLFGFRALRQENKWFKACFIFSVIRILIYYPTLILNTTILQGTFYESQVASILTMVSLILSFASFFAFWRGLRSVQKKTDLEPRAGSALALIFWYALLCLLAVMQYNGSIIPILMIIGYCFLLRSLYKLSKEFDKTGYAMQSTPVKISNKWLLLGITSLLLIGCTCGYLFGGSYPMNWTVVDSSEQTEVEDIKNHLIRLGFPKHILSDLTPEDIAACEGALHVRVEVNNYPVNEGREVTEYLQETSLLGNTQNVTRTETIYDTEELQCTSIAVRLSTTTEQWKIFHHFRWTTNPGFYGTESLRLSPAYYSSDDWEAIDEVTGRLLYDKDGTSYTAPYHSLSSKTYTSNSLFKVQQKATDIFANFSLPDDGENQRGYLSYATEEVSESFKLYSSFHYTHQSSWKQYPVITAQENSLKSLLEDDNPFKEIQDILLFLPQEEIDESSSEESETSN